ncbi:four-helix bundle copper-binding protein [Paenibacillus sp. sgz5001063]
MYVKDFFQVFAKICDDCATECAKFQDALCQACAEYCRKCADECRKMAS